MLPLEPTRLLGRDRDAAVVGRLLGQTRLLTLAGTGGSGKTRLALRVGRPGRGDLARSGLVGRAGLDSTTRAWWSSGSPGRSGCTEAPGRPVERSIVEAIGADGGLLVLDNCEHLIAACAGFAHWLLTELPGMRLLTTSREPLGVVGETTWPVPPLDTPGSRPRAHGRRAARQRRGRTVPPARPGPQPGFTVDPGDVGPLARLCRQLDGMPLAIELAAARARVAVRGQILDRLATGPVLLADRQPDGCRPGTGPCWPPWSGATTCSPRTNSGVFRRLSVFSGGFGLAAAERVAAGDDLAPAAVLDLLTGLVDKSLVVVRPDHPGGQAWYRLLETVRRFAAGKLAAAAETVPTRAAQLAWLRDLGHAAATGLTGPDQRSWIARLEADHDNIAAGLATLAQTSDVASGLRLLGQLGHYWWYTGRFAEGAGWIEMFLARPEAVEHPSARAAALHAFGLATVWHESAEAGVHASRDRFEAAIALYRELGDERGLAAALCDLGAYWKGQGETARARALLAESIGLAERLGDTTVVAAASSYLGIDRILCGRSDGRPPPVRGLPPAPADRRRLQRRRPQHVLPGLPGL